MNIDKISKLLAMAENASTPAEAELFFEKAQRLASLGSIELAEARQHAAKKTQRETPVTEHVTVGAPRQHVNKPLVKLFLAIADSNDIRMNVAHDSTYVILFGFPSDIEVAKLLWENIAVQMVRFADAYIREGSWRTETVQRVKTVTYTDGWGRTRKEERWGVHPLTAQSARASFYDGFINSVRRRLADARASEVQEKEEAWKQEKREMESSGASNVQQEAVESPTAIALRGKEVEVVDFYKSTSKAKGTWRGGRSTNYSSSSYSRGREDGQKARLSSAKGIGDKKKIGA